MSHPVLRDEISHNGSFNTRGEEQPITMDIDIDAFEEEQQLEELEPRPLGPGLAGRIPKTFSLTCDHETLSPYQVFVRKQIELFEADLREATTTVQGRNKQILVGQVGIRCRFCKHLSPELRTRGAVYFPTKLESLYQAGQNMAALHFISACQYFPQDLRDELQCLKDDGSSKGAGKSHWALTAQALGVYEDEHYNMLRFEPMKPFGTGTSTTS